MAWCGLELMGSAMHVGYAVIKHRWCELMPLYSKQRGGGSIAVLDSILTVKKKNTLSESVHR